MSVSAAARIMIRETMELRACSYSAALSHLSKIREITQVRLLPGDLSEWRVVPIVSSDGGEGPLR